MGDCCETERFYIGATPQYKSIIDSFTAFEGALSVPYGTHIRLQEH